MLTVLIIVAEGGTIIAGDGNVDLRFLNVFCNVFGFALTPVIPIVLVSILDVKILRTYKLLMLPSILNMFVTALSPWLGFIFYVDANGHYERGSLFFIFIIAYIINLIILLISTKDGPKHHYPIKRRIIALSLFAVAGKAFNYFSVVYAFLALRRCSFAYYLFYQNYGSFDTLTGLHNRAAFEKTANKLDGEKPYSVIVMDINNFKDINDAYGHDFGDAVLKKVASIIWESFDTRCVCYRIG